MLTPQEISEKVFVKAVFGGYDMTGVDDFLEAISADYAALYKENAILKSKIKVLVEKIEEYRSTEDAMRMALLTAQRMGEDIMSDANRKSAETIMRADEEIKAKLADMQEKLADEEARLNAAARETAKFVEISQEIIRRHSEFLLKLDKLRRAASPTPAPPPEPTKEEKIADTASQIGDAVEKLTAGTPAPAPAPEAPAPAQEPPAPAEQPFDDESEPTKPYNIKAGGEQDDEPVTPRPKFDFDNLKFGANFSKED